MDILPIRITIYCIVLGYNGNINDANGRYKSINNLEYLTVSEKEVYRKPNKWEC